MLPASNKTLRSISKDEGRINIRSEPPAVGLYTNLGEYKINKSVLLWQEKENVHRANASSSNVYVH